VHALGSAGTQSSGLKAAQYGAMVQRMNAGRAAQSGLYSAALAARGFTGIANVFESDYGGFCTTFSASKERFNLEELTSGLGERFETMQVSLKFYCAAASVHASLDALRAIRLRRPVAANEVEKVLIYGAHITVEHVGFPYRPTGMTGAQMNLPFCMATMLLEGDAFVDQFADDAITDPDRIALANRIQVIHDPEITALGRELRSRVRVEIYLRDGTVLRETTDTARGRESRFASETEVIEKFLKLASHVLPAGKTDALISSVLKLEQIENVEKLAALMTQD
jgi:2-methylcitrate dehydratase PrpD